MHHRLGSIHLYYVKISLEKIGPPKLTSFPITLRAYDGRPYTPIWIFENILVELASKFLINIEVLNA